eukprot:SAG31_NODE_1282_length_9017_cov_10.333146_7_plen_227_part_00
MPLLWSAMPPTVRLSSWLAEQPFDNSLLVDQRSKCLAARRERQPEQAAVVRAAAGMLPLEELEFGSDHGYVWPTQTAAAQATGTRTHALEPRLDEQPRGLGLHAQPVSAMSSQWLFDGCLASLQSMGVADVTHLQAAELAIRTWGLLISTRPGEQLQGEFLDLFGCDQLDFIGELLAGRSTLSTLSVRTVYLILSHYILSYYIILYPGAQQTAKTAENARKISATS